MKFINKYLLLFTIFINSSYAVDQMSCHITDQAGKLMRCDQLEKGDKVAQAHFQNLCLKKKFPSYQVIFKEYSGCPEQGVNSHCYSKSWIKQKRADTFYYYKMKNLEKAKAACLSLENLWQSNDDKDLVYKLLKQASYPSYLRCLKRVNFKIDSCEQVKLSHKDELVNFVQSCEQTTKDEFYSLDFNQNCPDLTQASGVCTNEVGNKYVNYSANSQENNILWCHDKRLSWLKRYQSIQNFFSSFKHQLLLSCLAQENNVVSSCHQLPIKDWKQFEQFYASCKVKPDLTKLILNQACPEKHKMWLCISPENSKMLNALYRFDGDLQEKFVKLCHKLNYKIIK